MSSEPSSFDPQVRQEAGECRAQGVESPVELGIADGNGGGKIEETHAVGDAGGNDLGGSAGAFEQVKKASPEEVVGRLHDRIIGIIRDVTTGKITREHAEKAGWVEVYDLFSQVLEVREA